MENNTMKKMANVAMAPIYFLGMVTAYGVLRVYNEGLVMRAKARDTKYKLMRNFNHGKDIRKEVIAYEYDNLKSISVSYRKSGNKVIHTVELDYEPESAKIMSLTNKE